MNNENEIFEIQKSISEADFFTSSKIFGLSVLKIPLEDGKITDSSIEKSEECNIEVQIKEFERNPFDKSVVVTKGHSIPGESKFEGYLVLNAPEGTDKGQISFLSFSFSSSEF